MKYNIPLGLLMCFQSCGCFPGNRILGGLNIVYENQMETEMLIKWTVKVGTRKMAACTQMLITQWYCQGWACHSLGVTCEVVGEIIGIIIIIIIGKHPHHKDNHNLKTKRVSMLSFTQNQSKISNELIFLKQEDRPTQSRWSQYEKVP